MKNKYLILITLAGFIVALDQILKLLIQLNYHLGESVIVINNFFSITYVKNFGAAFGMLSQAPPAFRVPFFIIVPLIALTIIVLIFRKVKETQYPLIISLALILGGAIGNLIDRIRFGYVVDYLDFHWFNKYHWPAFNLADMTICAGVVILVILTLFFDKKKTL